MKPFVKWAGGKTQLLDDIHKVIPKDYGTYYEPFLGGGALFFDIQPEKAVISDINPQLINAYKVIRDNVQDLMDVIDQIDGKQRTSKDLYYGIG